MSKEIVYPKEISDIFSIKETIGSGGFAKVKVAKHKITGEKAAIKIMEKSRLKETNDLHRAPLEIKALKELRHPHISRLYQVIETEERYFIVMEYAPGGELFDYIVAKDRLKEDEAREFFRQIISSVAYMHHVGYVHRDLKPENLLLDGDQKIKLIDFGLIGHPKNVLHDLLKTCCGSAAYAAPELIRGEMYIGPPADIWSLGILLYALLCGFLPFDDDDTQRLYKLIQRGTYEIPPWLSKESQEIIGAMLKHKPEHRITMANLLQHPWVLAGTKLREVDIYADYHANLDDEVIAEMAKFYGTDVEIMKASIAQWSYDEVTVLYELMALKHRGGSLMRLPANKSHLPGAQAMAFITSKASHLSIASTSSAGASIENLTAHSHTASTDSKRGVPTPAISVPVANDPATPVKTRQRAETVAAGNAATPKQLAVPDDSLLRSKMFVSQDIGTSPDKGVSAELLYRPTSIDDLRSPGRARGISQPPAVLAAASSQRAIAQPSSSSSAETSGFKGSFTRLAVSIKSAFGSSRNLNEPKVVKGLFNVSTTSVKDPRAVLAELLRVLQSKPNIQAQSEGFIIKCKVFNLSTSKHDMTIVFEVCKIARMEITGVKLKRVKGDTWQYKKLCQELLQEAKL